MPQSKHNNEVPFWWVCPSFCHNLDNLFQFFWVLFLQRGLGVASYLIHPLGRQEEESGGRCMGRGWNWTYFKFLPRLYPEVRVTGWTLTPSPQQIIQVASIQCVVMVLLWFSQGGTLRKIQCGWQPASKNPILYDKICYLISLPYLWSGQKFDNLVLSTGQRKEISNHFRVANSHYQPSW